LIEVTMAIGIVSLILLSIVGILPLGLESMNRATSDSLQTAIRRSLAAEISRTPFSKIKSWRNVKRFYDVNGIEVDEGADFRVAAMRVTRVEEGIRLPADQVSEHLARVHFEFFRNGNRVGSASVLTADKGS